MTLEWTDPGSLFASLAEPGAHMVQFYQHDALLTEGLVRFVDAGLAAGDAVLSLALPAHHQAVAARLHAEGVDLAAAEAAGRYLALDATEVLSRFMIYGRPDPRRFVDAVGGLVARAANASQSGYVRAFGEMVALLWATGGRTAALRLEEFWNDLAWEHSFSLLCAYPLGALQPADDALAAICAFHSHGVPANGDVAPASPFAVACRRCAAPLVATARITDRDAQAIREHLRDAHLDPTVPAQMTLEGLLREVVIRRDA